MMIETHDERGSSRTFSYPQFVYMRDHSRSVSLFAYREIDLNLSADDLTDAPGGQLVSNEYFSVLGVQPILGRGFASDDENVAVISHRYWRSRFHEDPRIVGRSITLNALPFTVIGVAPPRFFGVEAGRSPDVFVPLGMRDRLHPGAPMLPKPNNFWLALMGRLAEGINAEQARAEMELVYRQASSEATLGLPPGSKLSRWLRGKSVRLTPGGKGTGGLREQFEHPLLILMAVVGMVLLIACANVAGLLLARAAARRREFAVRLAIGAGRPRLIRQVLTESLLLSVLGGSLGLLFAFWSARGLVGFLERSVLDVSPDLRLLAFTLAVSILTGLLFGAAPAVQACRSNLSSALKNGLDDDAPRRRWELQNLLVVGQVAISLILLVGTGLFVQTLSNLRNLDAGFRAENVLLVSLDPGLSRYGPERTKNFYDRLLERVAALPGVRSASQADQPLLVGSYIDGLNVKGWTAPPGEDAAVRIKLVAPRFFETMGISLRAGRDFSALDLIGEPRTAIVNEALVRQFFGGRNPIGQRVGFGAASDLEIVGVIADTKYRDIREPFHSTLYVPLMTPLASAQRTLHVRTSAEPPGMASAIREQVRLLDKNLPIAEVKLFSDLVDQNLVQERLIATLSGCFGILALLLACVGLYGTLTCGVQRRMREIGIRMSLGADGGKVLRLILRDCFLIVTSGIVLGVPFSLWLSRFVSRQLFGVPPNDPATIAAATLLLVSVAGLAGYLPARRASQADPMAALRQE
jgi:predicted permease